MPPNLAPAVSASVVRALPKPVTEASEAPKSIYQQKSAVPERSMLELHRCRLIDWCPSFVVALAPSIDGSAIAAARESGDIEIWRVAAGSVGWACELRIPGHKDAAVSSLVWCLATRANPRGRLFSAGLNGHITEWDLCSLSPKAVVDSYGGPVWSLAVEPGVAPAGAQPGSLRAAEDGNASDSDSASSGRSDDSSGSDDESEVGRPGGEGQDMLLTEQRVAVACDDGCLRLFAAEENVDGLVYKRSFPRVAGRVLTVAWNSRATKLFTGGTDGCIRCWDAGSGRELLRITAGLGGAGKTAELCIWSLIVLRDDTVVSGDSSGTTQFWDGRYGTLLHAQTRHRADVLALAASPSHDAVFAGGVDGQIVLFQRLTEGGAPPPATDAPPAAPAAADDTKGPVGSWVYVGGRRAHTHDIRALAVAILPQAPPGEDEHTVPHRSSRRQQKRRGGGRPDPARWQVPGVAMLVSGGNDTQMFTYPANSFLAFHPYSICPAPQPPAMQLAASSSSSSGCSSSSSSPAGSHQRLLLVQQASELEVWSVDGMDRAQGQGHKQEGGSHGLQNGHLPSGGAGMANGLGSAGKRKGEEHKGEAAAVGLRKQKRSKRVPEGYVEAERMDDRHLATSEGAPGPSGGGGGSSMQPLRLVAKLKSSAAEGEHISCSAVSPDGRYLAHSSWSKLRLFEIRQQPPPPAVAGGKKVPGEGMSIKRRKLPGGVSAAHCLAFTADSTRLLVGARRGGIAVVDVAQEAVVHRFAPVSKPRDHSQSSPPPITLLCISRDGQWMAAGDSSGQLSIFSLETLRHHWTVPALDGFLPTAAIFLLNSTELVVATAGNRVHLLNIEAKALAPWSKANGDRLPRRLLEMPGGITGLSVPPHAASSSVVAYSSRFMCHIDFNKPAEEEEEEVVNAGGNARGDGHTPTPRPSTSGAGANVGAAAAATAAKSAGSQRRRKEGNFKVLSFTDSVLFVGHVARDSLLIVEKPWAKVLSKLPAPLYYHRYGT
eukprot:jgi/Mesen1/10501/ME000083S10004